MSADMPIQIIPECRFCHTAIEPTEPMGAWTHTGLSIWCPGSGQTETATPIIRVSKLGQSEEPKPQINEHGFPIYPVGTPVEEVSIRDRGQKMIFKCEVHPQVEWASKDPFVSRWFGNPEQGSICVCEWEHFKLSQPYSPTRNG